jgi:hypothetical protein
MRTVVAIVVSLVLMLTVSAPVSSQANPPSPQIAVVPQPPAAASAPAPLPDTNKGMAALQRASAGNRYLFVFFHNTMDQTTDALWGVFQAAMAKAGPRADSLSINILDANEKPIVDHFGVSRAPMPLVLAIAPNGAVMGGFPTNFNETQLLGAFGSPAMERTLKALQSQKLVLICVQNQSTQSNQAALQGVDEFRADPQFGPATEVVSFDPADPAEAQFVSRLQIDPTANVAQTVMMVPPGAVVGKFMAGTTKSMLISKLQSSGGCGPGGCAGGKCGPGGCAPGSAPQTQAQEKPGVVAKIKSAFGK